MSTSKLTNGRKLPKLPTTSFQEQRDRDQLKGREPNGLDRYPYMQALQRQMSVLDGAAGPNPNRYTPVMSCMDTLDCTCGRH